MTRIISGATALLCVAAVACVINYTRVAPMPSLTVWDHVGFFFAVWIALSTGALVFEVGKLMSPEKRS